MSARRPLALLAALAVTLAAVGTACTPGRSRASGAASTTAGEAASTGSGEALVLPDRTIAGRVVHVVDGDTVAVLLDGSARTEKVRLLGVDTPEAHASVKLDRDVRRRQGDRATILALGRRAAARTREQLDGRPVRLELDVRERDRYGRLLAWLWLEPDRLFNAELVRDGYARTLTIPPDVKYSRRLRELERTARDERRGLWADGL